MTGTKLWAGVLMLLVCGLIAAGCGDDEGSGSNADPNPVQQTTGLDEDAVDAANEAAEKAKQGDAEGAEAKIREACAEQAKASLSGYAEQQAVRACEE